MDQNHKMALATATRARLLALQCVHEAASGHPGGSMSCMDLLTVLYFGVMRIDPDAPSKPQPATASCCPRPLYPRPVFRAGTSGLLPPG